MELFSVSGGKIHVNKMVVRFQWICNVSSSDGQDQIKASRLPFLKYY